MDKPNLTLSQLKSEKAKAESDILKILNAFQEKTGLPIVDIQYTSDQMTFSASVVSFKLKVEL